MSAVKLEELLGYIETLPLSDEEKEKLINLIQAAENEAIDTIFFASTMGTNQTHAKAE